MEKFEPDNFVVFVFQVKTQNDESVIEITSDAPLNGITKAALDTINSELIN